MSLLAGSTVRSKQCKAATCRDLDDTYRTFKYKCSLRRHSVVARTAYLKLIRVHCTRLLPIAYASFNSPTAYSRCHVPSA